MTTAAGIIPARHASTRFPGKPLTPIAGVPMIQRVFERTREAEHLSAVYVATDDGRIADACAAFGAPVLMTSPDHPTGTDRLAEAAAGLDHEVIVNVQGDEPLIEGFVIDAAVDALLGDDSAAMSTVVHPLEGDARDDPNRVKVVIDRDGFALYFSRSPIPYHRTAAKSPTWQHVGLYAYRRPFLLDFVKLARTPAEQAEELEQLRALESGHRIRVAVVEGWKSVPVDVPEDVATVEALLGVKLDADTVRLWGEQYSNWGRWGPDDERGTLNFITPERLLAACALPRAGKVISCGLNFDDKGPQSGLGGRHNPIHTMIADGGDALAGAQDFLPGGFRYADDAVTMPLQCGTQWDALAHVFYDGQMYNGRDIKLVTSRGARANSIDKIKDGVVGRGILLDIPRYRSMEWLEDGTPIMPDELDACAESVGVTIESGDIVLVRTGMMTRCLEEKSWTGYCGGHAPGLSVHCARWLYEREIAAVCTDTWGVEVIPNETPDCFQPLHMVSLRNTGLLLGEIFYLDALAADCAEDGNYAFLFTAPPLPITGAVGSPINPLAIK